MNHASFTLRSSSPTGRRHVLATAGLLCLTLVGMAPIARAQTCLEVQPVSLSGTNPECVAAGDIDADGDADLVVATRGSSDVIVLRNLGAGSFVSEPALPTSSPPLAVALGDLDQDGDLDLAIATQSAGVLVRWNDGTGATSAGPRLATGLGSRSLTLVDFDGDGRLDLATANVVTASLSVILNAGGGAFLPQTILATSNARSIAVGDLDGDGDQDLVSTGATGGPSLAVFANLGGGVFGAPVSYFQGAGAWSAAIADVDGDGDLDVAMSLYWVDAVFVAFNDGSGSFPSSTSFGTGFGPQSILAADLTGDGRDDLVVGCTDRVDVLAVPIAGVSTSISLFLPLCNALVAADFDGDGDRDVAATDDVGQRLLVFRNCNTCGVVTCAGDGSAGACPCANFSPPGSAAGCLNGLGTGATLRATGSASLASDGLVLTGVGMTNSVALFLQGTTVGAGGSGVPFGDGLRCASGTIVRLALVTNSGGSSSFPGSGGPPVSVRGGVVAPGERVYQVWYRDAASFCPPATFNLTNGLRLEWRP